MGAAAGLIPCPSALVVLLGAIAQGQVALGMLLIVAFSAGLAATLTALGLAVVLATRPAPTLASAIGAIRARGLRVSTTRRLILEVLFAEDGPVSADALALEPGEVAASACRAAGAGAAARPARA